MLRAHHRRSQQEWLDTSDSHQSGQRQLSRHCSIEAHLGALHVRRGCCQVPSRQLQCSPSSDLSNTSRIKSCDAPQPVAPQSTPHTKLSLSHSPAHPSPFLLPSISASPDSYPLASPLLLPMTLTSFTSSLAAERTAPCRSACATSKCTFKS